MSAGTNPRSLWPKRLLLAYVLANALLYSMLLPLWEGFDEPFHFGYVQSLANGAGFPDARTSRLSEEIAASILLAPASLSVQQNLPQVTSYRDFFSWPEFRRRQVHQELSRIPPALRWQPSQLHNYEALQAPLAYAIQVLPERLLAQLPLPRRVLIIRILIGAVGGLLLFFGTERVCTLLGMSGPYRYIAIFCAISNQMMWATLAHVGNDWLSIPLSVWLLAVTLAYNERPGLQRAAIASLVLTLGLLTKAWFLAFIPLVACVCIVRRRWKDLGIAAIVVLGLAGPWYVRNLVRYQSISGMQESREGANPAAALSAVRLREFPVVILAWSRSALFTANNSFRAFSTRTLNMLIAAWFAALLLWVVHRRCGREWIVVFYSALFTVALAWDAALSYSYSHGIITSPASWYTQVLLVPMLALALLGASRSGKAGKVVAAAMTLLFGYVLICTYLVKLVPLYSGFEERTSLGSVVKLYAQRFPMIATGLNDVSLAPAAAILTLAAVVTVLAVAQQVVLIRQLFAAPDSG